MSEQNTSHPSRRHFLRGVGVALALPWLESLPLLGRTVAAAKANTPPLRLGIVFFSNGVEPIHWWAKGAGANMELGPGLTPMMPHREDMLFIQGLFNHRRGSIHQPPPRTDERPVGCDGQPRSERDPRRDDRWIR